MVRAVLLALIIALLPSTAIPSEKTKLIVAIVDTGLSPTDPRFARFLCEGNLHRDFTNEGLNDLHGHGTHIAGLITQNNDPRKFCIVIVKVFDHKGESYYGYERGIRYLRTVHPDVVNLSLSGTGAYEEETLLFRENPNTRFFAAAGNENLDLEKTPRYPAAHSKRFSNVISVGGLTKDGHKMPQSNYGLPSMVWERGEDVFSTLPNWGHGTLSGTSQATAITTGKYIRGLR